MKYITKPGRLLALATLPILAAMLSSPLSADEDVQQLEEQAMKAAVARVAPSVVRIETFGGLERVGRVLVGNGPTTGLVVDAEGYVVSSAFNFAQMPTSILVTLADGKRVAAKIVARDHSAMLVLLKLATDEKLAVPQAVPPREMAVGQWSIAVGRTYPGGDTNVSVGIVSATGRIWGKAIQTDAKISPNNYGGPLVDIRGRVLGVLVPLSPKGGGEVAGAEWYDSGIGFAIPLDGILRRLERMKKGEDLYAGVMGVALKRGDMYSLPAEIAACQPNSPAARAGLKAGDKIVEVDGVKIERQTQLKHQIGPRYAGEKIKVVALRGKDRIEAIVELTDKLDPYEHPFLGILPMRDRGGDKGGVVVRYVYPGSPAAEADIRAGDRITHLAGKPATDAAAMQETIAAVVDREKVKLAVERDGKTRELEIALATLPTDVPAALPPARGKHQPGGERPAVGVVDIKIVEEKGKCIAYVPETYDVEVPHGVVVWLDAPGSFDADELARRWKGLCEKYDLIVLAPQPAKPDKWERTEAAFVRKTLDDLVTNYNVDRTRIVCHGYQGGATMAYLVAFAHRDLVRGVAAVDAPVPLLARPPANDPVHRLAFYSARADESRLSARIDQSVANLRKMKYPVTVKDLGPSVRHLDADELAELARWIDTLDRI